MEVSEIWIYPVKVRSKPHLVSWLNHEQRFKYDRQWMVVEERTHLFQTARTHPRMVLIGTRLTADTLELTIPDYKDRPEATYTVPFQRQEDEEHVHSLRIWASPACDGYVIADKELNEHLSHFLGKTVFLVRKGDDPRDVLPMDIGQRLMRENGHDAASFEQEAPNVAWQDGFPFLLTTEGSIDDLTDRIPTVADKKGFDSAKWLDRRHRLESVRFRPNIVVKGAKAWEEDEWAYVDVGEHRLLVATRCARCVLPSVDPATAERDKVLPEAVMHPHRLDLCPQAALKGKLFFGMNAIPLDTAGEIRVGDRVNVAQRHAKDDAGVVVRPEDYMSF